MGYFVYPSKAPVIGLARILAEAAGTLAAIGVIGAFVVGRAPLHSRQVVLVCWAVANLVAVTAFREVVYVVPSLAIAGALGVERVWQWHDLHHRVLGRGLLLAISAVSIVMTTSFQRAEFARARFEHGSGGALTPIEELGWMLRRDLPPGPLFIYGNGAEMYPLAARTPATRYPNAEALRATAPGVAARAELVTTLRSHPPVIALPPRSDEAELNLAEYPSMQAFLEDCSVPKPIRPDIDASWTILVQTGVCGPS
jgi:hypothetical protein